MAMMDVLWWTGLLAWVAALSVILWAALHLLANAFDATWFLARSVFEGGTKNRSPRNLAAIWWAGFAGQLAAVEAAAGYRIAYPGYGTNVADED